MLTRLNADLPWYDYDADKNDRGKGTNQTIALTDANAAEWESFFNNIK